MGIEPIFILKIKIVNNHMIEFISGLEPVRWVNNFYILTLYKSAKISCKYVSHLNYLNKL